MPTRAFRANSLKPDYFIDLVEQLANSKIKDEVCVRRLLSGLYFSLFNYWAAISYDNGNRGKGPRQDRFSYREFHESLLSEGLDAELLLLYTYRVAVDHYVLNPTMIQIYNEEIARYVSQRTKVHITITILKKAVEAAKTILSQIRLK